MDVTKWMLSDDAKKRLTVDELISYVDEHIFKSLEVTSELHDRASKGRLTGMSADKMLVRDLSALVIAEKSAYGALAMIRGLIHPDPYMDGDNPVFEAPRPGWASSPGRMKGTSTSEFTREMVEHWFRAVNGLDVLRSKFSADSHKQTEKKIWTKINDTFERLKVGYKQARGIRDKAIPPKLLSQANPDQDTEMYM